MAINPQVSGMEDVAEAINLGEVKGRSLWADARARFLRNKAAMFALVLLTLLLIFALMTETLPAPNAFRGDEPSASMIFNDSVAITNRGIFIPYVSFAFAQFGQALIATVALLCAVGFLAKKIAVARQERTGRRPKIFLPLLCLWVLALAGLIVLSQPSVTYPELRGFNFRDGLHLRASLIALWLALSLYTAAFIAEIVRSGILAVSKGQKEAAAALGLSAGQTMRLVVLPQALRVIIPPMISNYLNLTKNSSLAIAVGYMDLTGTLMGITLNQTGRELETVLLGMSFYLFVSLSISIVLNWYNARVQLRER